MCRNAGNKYEHGMPVTREPLPPFQNNRTYLKNSGSDVKARIMDKAEAAKMQCALPNWLGILLCKGAYPKNHPPNNKRKNPSETALASGFTRQAVQALKRFIADKWERVS